MARLRTFKILTISTSQLMNADNRPYVKMLTRAVIIARPENTIPIIKMMTMMRLTVSRVCSASVTSLGQWMSSNVMPAGRCSCTYCVGWKWKPKVELEHSVTFFFALCAVAFGENDPWQNEVTWTLKKSGRPRSEAMSAVKSLRMSLMPPSMSLPRVESRPPSPSEVLNRLPWPIWEILSYIQVSP